MRIGGLVAIWAILLALLALSITATLMPALGVWRQAISLGIAGVKAGLILWFFMKLRDSDGLGRLALLSAGAFLAILMTLLAADYLTRGWLGG